MTPGFLGKMLRARVPMLNSSIRCARARVPILYSIWISILSVYLGHPGLSLLYSLRRAISNLYANLRPDLGGLVPNGYPMRGAIYNLHPNQRAYPKYPSVTPCEEPYPTYTPTYSFKSKCIGPGWCCWLDWVRRTCQKILGKREAC